MLNQLSKTHHSFKDFLSADIIEMLNNINETIKDAEFCPDKNNVLRFLQLDLSKIKIIILGQDPYPSKINGKCTATGRAYEVQQLNSFNVKFRQVSLKNFIRLIHKSLNNIHNYNDILSFEEIKKEIVLGNFKIAKPKDWFDSLQKQGVLFLNTSLTVELNKPLSHKHLWKEFIEKLLKYIGLNNPNIIYFLWGDLAKKQAIFINGKIFDTRHPMMCSNKYQDDFLKSDCILKTKEMIDWLGNV